MANKIIYVVYAVHNNRSEFASLDKEEALWNQRHAHYPCRVEEVDAKVWEDYKEMRRSFVDWVHEGGETAMKSQFLDFLMQNEEAFLEYYQKRQSCGFTRFIEPTEECTGYDRYLDEKYD